MATASPRDRRLRSDLEAMYRLQEESSILRFVAQGNPTDQYSVTFLGAGAWRDPASHDVRLRHEHVVTIGLTAAYPRMMPELSWKTPIFHPNISAGGVVCLGGYQTHWVPSLRLDELCQMLWDMIRFANYDVESPYNREAAIWAKLHGSSFPLDHRPLRDRIQTRPEALKGAQSLATSSFIDTSLHPGKSQTADEVIFLEAEIIEPTVSDEPQDILFID